MYHTYEYNGIRTFFLRGAAYLENECGSAQSHGNQINVQGSKDALKSESPVRTIRANACWPAHTDEWLRHHMIVNL